jgi:expansin
MSPTLPRLLIAVAALLLLTGVCRAQSDAEEMYENDQTGEATYYGHTNAGNCGITPRPSWASSLTYLVALNQNQYVSDYQSGGCGICLEGRYLGTGAGSNPPADTFTALVVDRCPGCAVGDLDLATTGDGRWDIEWRAIDCPVGSQSLRYQFEGSNQWYMKLGVRNHRVAVDSMEVQTQTDGAWVKASRTQDNFFECSGCAYPMDFPLPVRVTSITGQVIEDTVQELVTSGLVDGEGKQFSGFGSSIGSGSTSSTSSTTSSTSSSSSTTGAGTSGNASPASTLVVEFAPLALAALLVILAQL